MHEAPPPIEIYTEPPPDEVSIPGSVGDTEEDDDLDTMLPHLLVQAGAPAVVPASPPSPPPLETISERVAAPYGRARRTVPSARVTPVDSSEQGFRVVPDSERIF